MEKARKGCYKVSSLATFANPVGIVPNREDEEKSLN